MTIPKIFIRKTSWKYDNLPQIFKDIYDESLRNNPEYELKYFDDDDADNFIETNFPQYIKYYRELIPKAFKCDIFRLLALYYYGGIYMDCGLRLLKQIKDFIKHDDELIFVKAFLISNGIDNSFIAAKPNHHIILEVLNYIIDNRLKLRNKGTTQYDVTGSQVIAEFFKNYSQESIRYFQFNSTGDYILHENNEQLVKNKFEEYYNLVYNNNLEYRYDTLWKKDIVFFPRIIHQTGPTDLNRWLNIWKLCQQTWKNNFPDWEYKFWTDQDIEDIVKNDYPSLYQIYKRYNYHIKRVDLARYCILHKYGGIYADLDYECIKNFEHLIRADKVSFVASPWLLMNESPYGETHQNSLMFSPPQHPFWNIVFKYIKIHRMTPCTLYSTGPQIIMKAINEDPYNTFTLINKLFCPHYNKNFRICEKFRYDYDALSTVDDDEWYGRHYGTAHWP